MIRASNILPALAVLAALVLAGCHAPEGVAAPSFQYTGTDYAFDGPAELPAGWVELELVNNGQEVHHIQLIRMEEGRTAMDLAMAMDGELLPDWATYVGGPNAAPPGGMALATLHLEAGPHVMICVVPDRAGVPHVEHGMVLEVSVVDEDNAATEPHGDVVVDMTDFAFDGVPGLGAQMVQVTNSGSQGHELTLFGLDEGATTQDLLMAFGPNATGPPPGRAIGGISAIAPGDVAYFPTDLDPGRYTMVCFFPDPETGQPHFLLGMVHEFTA